MTLRLPALAIVVLGASIPSATAVAATTKEACFTSYEDGQRLRQHGKLRAAREQLAMCASETCPPFVRKECSDWLQQVERSMPKIVVSPIDERGERPSEIQVFVDRVRVTEPLDQGISVDPGEHAVRATLGSRSIEEKVVLVEGEQRTVVARFSTVPPPDAPQSPAARGIPTATWVLGGVSVLGFASFATFAIAGKSAQECAGHCTREEVDSVRTHFLVADVSLLVAIFAGAGAAYFALSRPSAQSSTSPPAWGAF
jgi:hypothetical protein